MIIIIIIVIIKKPYSASTMFVAHGIPSFYEVLRTSIYRFADRVSKNLSSIIMACMTPIVSGYRAYHSTETAMLKISNDILTKKDNNESTGLVCIDLSAAFDLVDHSILLKRLFDYFGIRRTAMAWFKSYLTGRSQRVLIDDVRSDKKQLRQGVPQGSVLGARLYTLYVRPLSDVIQRHSVLYHTYADDTQIYVKFNKNCLTGMQMSLCQLEHCIADISCWMSQNGLKLNHEKTEWIIFNGNTNLIKDVELHIGNQTIQQSKVIKNLGVKLDSELTLQSQISDVCRISY